MTTVTSILTFHRIENRSSVISVPPPVFRRGIARLHRHGYRTINLLEAADILRRRKFFPPRSLMITFDDGYKSIYVNAFPVLQQYGMSATVFLTVGKEDFPNARGRLPSLENRVMLSWNEIREMHRSGITFGAPTLTHQDQTRLKDHELQEEIYDSKAIIEDAIGAPIFCFAYPYGRYDSRSRAFVQQHFACACSDRLGQLKSGSDLFAPERADAYYLRTDWLFRIMLTRFFPWYIRIRNFPRHLRRRMQ